MRVSIISLIIVCLTFGCRPAKPDRVLISTTKDTSTTGVDSIKLQKQVLSPSKAVVKPNMTFVAAVIDTIVYLDEFNYRLKVWLNTAIPTGGMESLIEPGQELEIYPEYALTEGGEVDVSNERNKKLLLLRNAQPKDAFMGNISLNSFGKWVIISVEDIMTNR